MSETGLLTSKQREYLEKGELDGAAERMMRKRLQERLRHAFLDFHLLLEHYDADELAKATDPARNREFDRAHELGGEAAASGIGFILAARATNHLWQFNHGPDDWEGFEPILAKGITRAIRFHGYAADRIDVDLTVEARRIESLDVEGLATLPFDTIMEMGRTGDITDEEVAKAMQLHFDRREDDVPAEERTTVEFEEGKISISYGQPDRDN